MKWFVTTEGYEDVFFSFPEKFGEHAGTFLFNSRCIGYYDTEEEAVHCVMNNLCDIYECGYYPYAIIEPLGSGLYPHDGIGRERFFWWYADKYIEINRPHWAEQTCNFGIG